MNDRTVTAAYVDGITEERRLLRGMISRGEYNGARDARAILANIESTMRRGFSGEMLEHFRGGRDFWRGQLKRLT